MQGRIQKLVLVLFRVQGHFSKKLTECGHLEQKNYFRDSFMINRDINMGSNVWQSKKRKFSSAGCPVTIPSTIV